MFYIYGPSVWNESYEFCLQSVGTKTLMLVNTRMYGGDEQVRIKLYSNVYINCRRRIRIKFLFYTYCPRIWHRDSLDAGQPSGNTRIRSSTGELASLEDQNQRHLTQMSA